MLAFSVVRGEAPRPIRLRRQAPRNWVQSRLIAESSPAFEGQNAMWKGCNFLADLAGAAKPATDDKPANRPTDMANDLASNLAGDVALRESMAILLMGISVASRTDGALLRGRRQV